MDDERTSDTTSAESGEPQVPSRGDIVRDTILFQLKLMLDGLKDLVLAPLSIAAAVLDLLQEKKSDAHLYKVLYLGQRFDHWLDLYGGSKGGTVPQLDEADNPPATIDDHIRSATDPKDREP